MSVEGAIFTQATTHAGLSALISTRAYFVRGPQNPTKPFVVFTRVSAEREHASGTDANPTHAGFQITAMAADASGARDVADQVKLAFDRWSGTVDSTVIQGTLRDGSDLDLYDDVTKTYMVPVDFTVHYEE